MYAILKLLLNLDYQEKRQTDLLSQIKIARSRFLTVFTRFTEGLWYARYCDGSAPGTVKSAWGPLWQDLESGKEEEEQEW